MATDLRVAAELKQTAEEAHLNCVHCGFCLPKCPTYVLWGLEPDSPRGRIYIMNGLEKGDLQVTDVVKEHLYLCLDCRACETACPSGVEFGYLMEKTRGSIEPRVNRSPAEKLARWLFFHQLFPYPGRLRVCFVLLRMYQRSGLQKLTRASGILKLLGLDEKEAMLPAPARKPFRLEPGQVFPAVGEKRHRVRLLSGCVMNEMLGDVHRATVEVLTRNGCEVVIPPGQVCCGALHNHSGERKQAEELARRNIDAFEKDGLDAVIMNAAGCGAMTKEYGRMLSHDPAYAERAHAFSAKVKDISEFLDGIGLTAPLGPLELKLTYDDPCHLLHGQKIRQAPRNLLARIPGIEFAELEDADMCCGSAGTYNLTEPETSLDLLKMKMANIARTGAQVVATGNAGCMLQIAYGARKFGPAVEVKHPIQLLADSLQK
ncbi:MAG: 4Fe-4S dicluster domain-containing protein, partial [Acidobacteria bacterium]|nr:4Fe-4S dicluster domain-containing protein [Acidobacteriota bacterium]